MLFFTQVPLIDVIKSFFKTGYSIGHVRHIEGNFVSEHVAQLSFGLHGSHEFFIELFIYPWGHEVMHYPLNKKDPGLHRRHIERDWQSEQFPKQLRHTWDVVSAKYPIGHKVRHENDGKLFAGFPLEFIFSYK